ncbi:sensor histidine kinase [Terrihabitans rhizophilus]|uniref:Blue-light-activated histidine kinase n=1 Tax=Terrihabitans rhizophilus TaxID=3092662 RepID=A0ABU4RM53_9HYPH|nr:HWE histidine kinase domain-containing protein [Terrihabitans sp. PJ23]MDX6805898.1 HWE histidine kinase domain-containing protein [Terrihabitans sp. PJ23]
MDSRELTGATGEIQRLLDENEQLRTSLESSLDENSRLAEDRDRLLHRVTVLARELQLANAAYQRPSPAPSPLDDLGREALQSQTEEELRVAFEELQVVTEELEVANASLQQTNAQLEARVQERTRELATINAALRKSEAAFRTLIEGIPQLPWRSRRGGDWTWSSQQWTSYTGRSREESLGPGWLLALHPDDRARAEAAWAAANPAQPLEFPARIYHAREGRYRHFHTRAAPVLTEDGAVAEWLGTCTDVDDILQLQQRQRVLVDELQHRTRNLMSVVQAVMLRTIKGSTSLEEFQRCMDDRMQALARAQGLLSRSGGGKVTFDALLHEELSAHVDIDEEGNGAQVSTSGARGIPLPSSSVQTLALALHELATNATKYGALATADGRLDVQWDVLPGGGDAPRLRMEWTESSVGEMPLLGAEAKGGGYGRELIERALPYQLGARTSYSFGADGVRCMIEVPVSAGETRLEDQA